MTDKTQAMKAVLYDQTVLALQEMIDRSSSDLAAQAAEVSSIFSDNVRRFYGSHTAATLSLRAERVATLNDILGMMTR